MPHLISVPATHYRLAAPLGDVATAVASRVALLAADDPTVTVLRSGNSWVVTANMAPGRLSALVHDAGIALNRDGAGTSFRLDITYVVGDGYMAEMERGLGDTVALADRRHVAETMVRAEFAELADELASFLIDGLSVSGSGSPSL